MLDFTAKKSCLKRFQATFFYILLQSRCFFYICICHDLMTVLMVLVNYLKGLYRFLRFNYMMNRFNIKAYT
jgi:hypothetical protein